MKKQNIPAKDKFRNKVVTYALALMFIKKIKKKVAKTRHRMLVLNEWFTTQTSYQTDLSVALLKIRQPLLEQQIITFEQSKVLCPQFDGIIGLSKMMLSIITQYVDPNNPNKKINPNKIMIGQKISKIVQGYKIYGGYFRDRPHCQKLIAKLATQKPQKMKQIQKNLQQHFRSLNLKKKENMTIKDCLEQPLYRLFKYVLLMHQYLKRLPHSHKDYEPLKNAQEIFKDINHFNNQLMIKLQQQGKKIKLEKLMGRLPQGSISFISEMKAQTIQQFKVKLYIFNTFVLLTKYQGDIIEKQQKYLFLEFDQFSFTTKQSDTKYFKNVLAIAGKQTEIHLLFPDSGSREQVYKCVDKVLKQLRFRQFTRRKLGGNQNKKKDIFELENKIQTKQFVPGWKIQVLGCQQRPLGTTTNDTVYMARFMIPQYYDDWENFIKQQINRVSTMNKNRQSTASRNSQVEPQLTQYLAMLKNPNWINHQIFLHLSQLQSLQKQIKQKFPYVHLPQINLLTKDLNFFSQGLKKTKQFQVRCFFIQQFLNSLYRHPIVMGNPIQINKRIGVQPTIWQYIIIRNQIATNNKQSGAIYGLNHCNTCNKANIKSLEEFQHYRNFFARVFQTETVTIPSEKYCLNFYNIARLKLLQFPSMCFNTIDRVLTYAHHSKGRIDYPFLKRYRKKAYSLDIYLINSAQQKITLKIFKNTAVGQILQMMSRIYKVPSFFDYGVILDYGDRERILDNDQIVVKLAKKMGIKLPRVKQSNKSDDEDSQQQTGGILSAFKNMFSSNEFKLKFKKIIYLNKQIELRTLKKYPAKYSLLMQQTFYLIQHCKIPLKDDQIAQISGLYYCLKQLDQIKNFSRNTVITNRLRKIMPFQKIRLLEENKIFVENILKTIENNRNKILSNYQQGTILIHQQILNILYQKMQFKTFFAPAQIHTLQKLKQYVGQTIYLGVNFGSILIYQSLKDFEPLLKLPINQIKCELTVKSIFITYQNQIMRFDGKMFYCFNELISRYQSILQKFPQLAT